jgi:hypothetical protein
MTGKAFIYLIITLLIGFALGLFSDALLHLRRMKQPERMEPLFMMEQMLIKELQLSGQQQEQVSEILERYDKKIRKTREAIRKKSEADFDSLRMELVPYLTEAQVQILNELRKPGPPRPPGPQMPPGHEPRPGFAPLPGPEPLPGKAAPPPVKDSLHAVPSATR